MFTNGSYTTDNLRHIHNLIIVPILFNDPKEGYIAFMQSQALNPIPVRKNTIPAMILKAEGKASLWGLTLPRVISGEHERGLLSGFDNNDAAVRAIEESDRVEVLDRIANNHHLPHELRWAASAKSCRLRFNAGEPLYIGMWQNPHRYQNLVPVLRYRWRHRYTVGSRQNHLHFQAESHKRAVDLARSWYEEQHHKEIETVKKQARRLKIPLFVSDVLGAILDTDGVIYDQHDTRVAWKNGGVHGRFGIVAPHWCYIVRGAPTTAAKLLVMAQQEAKKEQLFAPLKLNVAGRLHAYFGFAVEGDRLTCKWGEWRPSTKAKRAGVAYADGERTPRFQLRWGIQNGVYRCCVMNIPQSQREQATVLVESVVPQNWNLTDTDVIAWGYHRGILLEKRKNG